MDLKRAHKPHSSPKVNARRGETASRRVITQPSAILPIHRMDAWKIGRPAQIVLLRSLRKPMRKHSCEDPIRENNSSTAPNPSSQSEADATYAPSFSIESTVRKRTGQCRSVLAGLAGSSFATLPAILAGACGALRVHVGGRLDFAPAQFVGAHEAVARTGTGSSRRTGGFFKKPPNPNAVGAHDIR